MTKIILDRCDAYLFYASNLLPKNPALVEIGSFSGKHAIKLAQRFSADGNGNIIVYEASASNFRSLSEAVSGLPIKLCHTAVTGQVGEVELFEFEAMPSSNSVYPRHLKEKRKKLEKTVTVRSVSLEQLMAENQLDYIDVLFSNCEGAELGFLDELIAKPELRKKIGQLCISFHGGKIYDEHEAQARIADLSESYWVHKDESKWPCHLFVNKDLLEPGQSPYIASESEMAANH